jgi:hypothetical protein
MEKMMGSFREWLGPRTHANYWSCSKFARWITKTFANFEKPSAETAEGWDAWNRENKTNHPFVYWLAEEFLDKVQNVVTLPSDIWNTFRYKTKVRFFDKLHYLPTRLKPGEYYDLDTRILHGLMESLVDFVEVEKAHMQLWSHPKEKRPLRYRFPLLRFKSFRSRELGMKYLEWEMSLDQPNVDEYGFDQSNPRQANDAKEIVALYTWWKDVRPNRPDPYDQSGWTQYCEDHPRGMFAAKTEEENQLVREKLDALGDLERQYDEEDEQMIIRLIKIRKSLWT